MVSIDKTSKMSNITDDEIDAMKRIAEALDTRGRTFLHSPFEEPNTVNPEDLQKRIDRCITKSGLLRLFISNYDIKNTLYMYKCFEEKLPYTYSAPVEGGMLYFFGRDFSKNIQKGLSKVIKKYTDFNSFLPAEQIMYNGKEYYYVKLSLSLLAAMHY